MRRILIIPTALILGTIALSGCAAAPSSYSESGGAAPQPQVAQSDESVKSDSLAADGTSTGTTSTDADRAVITTGYVTITVDNPTDAAAEATRITEQAGGRIDERTEYAPVNGDKGSATLTLRIPADTLDATLDKLRKLGAVQEVSLTSADVTMQTQDIDARIKALTASIDRLLALEATATDTATLIQIETAVSDRQAELESLQSQQRYYADQVSLSTVTLNLVSEYTAPPAEPDTFWSGLVAGWNAFVGFFAGLLVALGVLLPWLVFAGIVTFVVILIVRRAKRRATVTEAPVETRKK